MSARPPPDRVVVIGGGLAGLVTAHRLGQLQNGRAVEVTVLEEAGRAGGKIQTGEVAGFPIEDGPDSFVVRKPWAVDLCRELGLGPELVAPAPGGTYVWARGALRRFPTPAAFGVPASIEDLLRWPGLSRRGRLRAAADVLRPRRRGDGDESIMDLLARRMGREAGGTLVGPLLAGLHAGDAEHLSVAATFPELKAWEDNHGSLIRGSKAALKVSRRTSPGEDQPMFATVWTGLSRVIDVLTEAIGPHRVHVGARVSELRREDGGWAVVTDDAIHLADGVVLAVPAFEAARLLERHNEGASKEAAAISYASTAVATLVYPEGTLTALPPGTGFIAPPGAGLETITACTFVSSKWPRAEHRDRAVVRCFIGRAGDEGWARLDDAALIERVSADVRTATGVEAVPEATRVVRWMRSMPQYEVGHVERVERIELALEATPGVFVVGSAYRGVGMADCVRQGTEAAALVRTYLFGRPRPPGAQRDMAEEARS